MLHDPYSKSFLGGVFPEWCLGRQGENVGNCAQDMLESKRTGTILKNGPQCKLKME